ncbi:Uncharacterised protein [Mycobacteroides abscessus subsp. abscessus]|uniref:Lipoprotein n=1 Tax=Mycobacteroides abscessus subsp. massiliense TaxID=1962118 RepID=A0A1U0KLW2_9MYCO|nr:hypothetical protein E3G66_003473 [Mycobacteroides abscessus]SHO98354.1 Uncharacterised protein [Mycobacteroides abscessus subsp. abscessus]SKM34275.1 Uncharacterised protein [Mycobacteroides abscessus subsp. massiliense]SHP15096.1 Uncharacterised protein [Mycobacteroides abscessus subsp. abscessus]SHP86169.1 Uncharacterised protein [Mycobacteroides abscessus subsp. abscessus]
MSPRRWPIAIALVCALTACGNGPAEGKVVDTEYSPAWTQYVPGTPGSTTCSGSPPRCNTYPGTPPQWIPHSESWRLRLDNGKEIGWREVSLEEYEACSRDEHYPECAKGETR